jgi:hypothetical protein
MANFSRMLMEAKRRAQLQGRPLSRQEVSGIAEGYAAEAPRRLAVGKGIEIEEERLELDKETRAAQLRAAERAEEAAEKQRKITGTAVGAVGGYYAGGAIGGLFTGAKAGSAAGPPGALIGAAVGAILGFVGSDSCMIVTACTHRDSYEVEIARFYRDYYMDSKTLFGYYVLCPFVVALMVRFNRFHRFIKKLLVDRLIDHGEIVANVKNKAHFKTSGMVTHTFLKTCRLIGSICNIILKRGHKNG